MRARLAVLGLIGLAGCDQVWSIKSFPVFPNVQDPKGDFDGDGVPNVMDGCPNLDNSMPGGTRDRDGDGVPDLCDPNPDTPGDCLVLFDDFAAPTLSPKWNYDGIPITVIRNDPIFMNQPYLQFDPTDEEIIYLADWAAQARATHHAGDQAGDHPGDADKVVRLLRKDDAA